MKSRLAIIALVAAGLIAVAVGIIIFVTVSADNSSENTSEVTQVERTLSGKSVAEDKADVMAAAVALLSAANAPLDTTEFSTKMSQIESGELTMSDELSSKIRLVDSLENEDGIDATIYQTLVSFGAFAKQSTGQDAIVPLYDNAADGITLDQEAGVAYVPTTLFVNSGTGINGFSMEFIYLDGQWLFSPYMTLDELRLAIAFQSGIDASQ